MSVGNTAVGRVSACMDILCIVLERFLENVEAQMILVLGWFFS